MFSEEQLEQLRSFPEISRDELIRYFTLTPADVAFVIRVVGGDRRTGWAWPSSLCTLPWLGFVPDDVTSAPPVAVARLAERLGVDPGVLRGYGQRAQTRSDHLAGRRVSGVEDRAGRQPEMKELEQFLLDRAMEHDSPTLLFNLAREYLMSAKVIRPGAVMLAKMVGTARDGGARADVAAGGAPADGAGPRGSGPAAGGRRRAGDDPAGVADHAGGGGDRERGEDRDREAGPARHGRAPAGSVGAADERRRFLATVGRRSTVQALERREERRYPILLALVAQSAVDQLDEVVALFDQAVSARESRAKSKTDEALAERAKKGEDRQLLMDVILPVLADPSIPDEQVGGILRERIGMERLREVDRRARGSRCPGITAGCRRWIPPTPTCGSSPRRCWPRSTSRAGPARRS